MFPLCVFCLMANRALDKWALFSLWRKGVCREEGNIYKSFSSGKLLMAIKCYHKFKSFSVKGYRNIIVFQMFSVSHSNAQGRLW